MLANPNPNLPSNPSDFQLRQPTTMTHRAVITFPAAIFVSNHLLAFVLGYNLRLNGCPFHLGSRANNAPISNHQHVTERRLATRLTLEFLDANHVPLGNSVLLSTRRKYCVRHMKMKVRMDLVLSRRCRLTSPHQNLSRSPTIR